MFSDYDPLDHRGSLSPEDSKQYLAELNELQKISDTATPAGQNNPPAQTTLLDNFDQLNEEGQTKALDYVEDLVLTGRYKKAAAHGVAAKEA